MRRVTCRVSELIACEGGPTATEYAVALGLIIVVALAAIAVLGQNADTIFANISESITGDDGGGGGFSDAEKSAHPGRRGHP